jgi:beta-phosphoglucomutase-like phosphatase (HAD superfamily)
MLWKYASSILEHKTLEATEEMMTVRAVFVDVDGTTADTEPRNRRAIEEAARIGGFHIKKEDWNHLAGQGDSIIWDLISQEKPDFKDVFNTGVAFELACLNAKLDRIHEIKKIDETAEAIQLFRENAIEIAAVSNSIRRDAQASLRHSGYTDKDFVFELFRDDLREAGLRAKPYPDPYIEALRRLNEKFSAAATAKGESFTPIKPSECVVLEDSKTGARAGLAAGMNTIQMTDESPGLDADEANEMETRYNGNYFPVSRAGLVPQVRSLLNLSPGS